MPLVNLLQAQPQPGKQYYLDTSGLMVLAISLAVTKGASLPPDPRLGRLAPFLSRARKAGALVQTSVLAIEELAAVIRNAERSTAAKAGGFSWKDFKRLRKSEALAADVSAQQQMLKMMTYAVEQLATYGVQLVERVVNPGEQAAAATTLRKAHRELVRCHVELDPMDALHIVTGHALGADSFISFDGGWEAVPTIDVLR